MTIKDTYTLSNLGHAAKLLASVSVETGISIADLISENGMFVALCEKELNKLVAARS